MRVRLKTEIWSNPKESARALISVTTVTMAILMINMVLIKPSWYSYTLDGIYLIFLGLIVVSYNMRKEQDE